MTNPVLEAQQLGQSTWYDNISRGLISSGGLQRMLESGVTGLTSNPSIFEKSISGTTDYDDALSELAKRSDTAKDIFESLAIEDIRDAADLLRPVYDRTGGVDGYVSLEVGPELAHDTEETVAEARRLFHAVDRPNLLIKVPATPEGIPAIRTLIGEGVNVNVTLIFSLDFYREVREAYLSGLEDRLSSGKDIGGVASVASFFVSRVDSAVDALLSDKGLPGLFGKAAVANSKLAFRDFQETFNSERFARLKERGAMVQRLLWGSTSTKNPDYSDLLYVEELIGPDTINTMPQATLDAYLDHGTALSTLGEGLEEAQHTIEDLEAAGISMKRVTDQLLAEGVKAFADSFDKLLAHIEDKRASLIAAS